MITKLFNNPHVLSQSPDEADGLGIAEPAISASTDASGLIVLVQEGREILVNRKSVPELCRMLRKMVAA